MTPASLDRWLREHAPAGGRLRWTTYAARGRTCVTLQGSRRRVRWVAGMLLGAFGADEQEFEIVGTRFNATWKVEIPEGAARP